ncbi:uncharacterized protein LOC111325572 [Stylophora pistillata]|uniref:Uncharacterized protein n=1 Tax=Stylophora pistillata TaxID=50429 RepID=A0A2B4SZW5_STYPI|nr:uncharacterized protein LOC111325572 [Stylophora pistillata]PFX34400.1 hypothetical protein AWC38_SpisGene703 [Stylophora pistillata]
MAENCYSVKTALRVGIVQILGGLIGVGIGAFNTREEDHRAFFRFKPEGLPVWSGILFIVTGGVGCLSYKHAKKSTIHFFLMFCILTVITSILMFWIILPLIVSGKQEVSWNLFFGSFLGVVAIIFVVSMKGAFVAFKSSFFQHNCCIKPPPLQRAAEPVELSTSVCMMTSTSVASENTLEEIRQQRRISRSQSQSTSTPHHHSRHSNRHHRPRGHSSRRGVERESRIARYDERPPPPAYQTIKFPYLPAYQEVDESLPPPPYTEKKEDT